MREVNYIELRAILIWALYNEDRIKEKVHELLLPEAALTSLKGRNPRYPKLRVTDAHYVQVLHERDALSCTLALACGRNEAASVHLTAAMDLYNNGMLSQATLEELHQLQGFGEELGEESIVILTGTNSGHMRAETLDAIKSKLMLPTIDIIMPARDTGFLTVRDAIKELYFIPQELSQDGVSKLLLSATNYN